MRKLLHMRGNPGDNRYWGNDFINDANLQVAQAEWLCVELLMKMNNPLTSYNGEQALWINGQPWYKDGQKTSHFGLGFPKGNWVWFDNVVVAMSYIGPMGVQVTPTDHRVYLPALAR